ncbi:hypothetical protein M407DRAFT_30561 [Tulasnella calospora MUT 4182]|uniref:Uncharacterized protein n=1 Tax=Tulasnella calospora MUT 4182 TaxID=1051891 RepID=A0A0C3Q743_9AGAM|nr:hypothetical protein M407DRAFT_30561 [Tulasnella calospora MUT 4182]
MLATTHSTSLMGKKASGLTQIKVGPPTQSRKQSDSTTSNSSTRQVKASDTKASETATATVERIFGGAKSKFMSRLQAGPSGSMATSSAAPASEANGPTEAVNPSSSARRTPSPPKSSPLDSDSNSESDDEDSISESAGLNDVDGHAFDNLGSESSSGSESETDAEASVAPTPTYANTPSTKAKGKQKERNVSSGSSSKGRSETKSTASKPKASRNLAHFGQIVFVPIVPVVLPGSIIPTLPLPTPHESQNLRQAGLGAIPSPDQSIFVVQSSATNREVKRYFRTILPKPFKAMGKKASFHLMYSHSRTLGGCGTDSPTGFDISTAYRAGKANNLKVLYLAPVEPISEAKIQAWKLGAIVQGIKDQMQGKKRKRSSQDESESENEAEESGSADENGSEAGDSVGTGGDSIPPADDTGETTTPPRKKIKLDREPSPSIASHSASSPTSTTATHGPTKTVQANPSRVLRDRNRVSASASNSKSKAKLNDPLNPWYNPSGYVL